MIRKVGTAEMQREMRVEDLKVTVWSPLWREKGRSEASGFSPSS
jgi:hypothetical protein